jgi:uncharacterized protein (DUF1501 family)
MALLSRRQILAGGLGVAATTASGRLWARPAAAAASGSSPVGVPAERVLVVVTLSGGNDGLNTVIPYGDPIYQSQRPSLAWAASQVIPLADGLGLPTTMGGFGRAWTDGTLAVVRGVSYPDPDHSHFSSMAKWQSGDPSGQALSGWVGRLLDQLGDPRLAVSIGSTLPLLMTGEKVRGVTVPTGGLSLPLSRPGSSAYAYMATAGARPGVLADIAATDRELTAVGTDLSRILVAVPRTKVAGGSLGPQLDLVSRLIQGGAPARIYQVSVGGFDTHVNEKSAHASVLGQVDQAVTSFLTSLGPHQARVAVMTYSEFGRRVAVNASSGTDHGTSGPVFVVGQPVQGGFYGDEPALSDLVGGDLKVTTDYRDVYATLLGPLLGFDPSDPLGGSFNDMGFVRSP